MASIADFKSYISGGMAVNSHFITEIFLPDAMINYESYASNLKKLNLFCDQVQIPGISFSTNQVRSYGEFREVPYEKLYEPLNMSFYVDAGMIVKHTFDRWMEMIQDPSSRNFNYYHSYISNVINILVEDKESRARYKVELYECFPKSVSPIQLDYSARDVMKVNVNMVYKYSRTYLLTTVVPEKEGSRDYPISPIEDLGDYGYRLIPETYYSNFEGFQEALNNYDFSFDGVRSALKSFEGLDETTGFGSVIGGIGKSFG